MGIHLLAFVGVAILVVITPGPDTLLVTKNALLHGRRVGLATVAGVSLGLIVWTTAAALGIAALVRESELAFTLVKIFGALYLAWLGLSALRAASHPLEPGDFADAAPARVASVRQGYRQGLLTNLGNPKIAIFFTSFLPQFAKGDHPSFTALLLLAVAFSAIGLAWLSFYNIVIAKAGEFLRRPTVRRVVEGVTGTALVAFGITLAVEHR